MSASAVFAAQKTRKVWSKKLIKILIKKLEKYGIRGLPLQLLASYLTDRQQYSIVNQYKSKSRAVADPENFGGGGI